MADNRTALPRWIVSRPDVWNCCNVQSTATGPCAPPRPSMVPIRALSSCSNPSAQTLASRFVRPGTRPTERIARPWWHEPDRQVLLLGRKNRARGDVQIDQSTFQNMGRTLSPYLVPPLWRQRYAFGAPVPQGPDYPCAHRDRQEGQNKRCREHRANQPSFVSPQFHKEQDRQ